ARRIGLEAFEKLCQHRGLLVGEWLFSVAAFGNDAPDPDSHFLDLLGAKPSDRATRQRLRQMRNDAVPAYLEELLEQEPWQKFKVVGFTSTFQQNTPSLALAR